MLKYGCEGLTAVISGGTSGIGLGVALKLAGECAAVYLLGRNAERGKDAVALVNAAGGKAYYVPCDVRSVNSCEGAAAVVAEMNAAPVDILVNSAGVFQECSLGEITEADYSELMDTNVKGTLFLTQAFLPQLGEGASIVNIASDAGINGNYGCPVYCASKGAVVALTRALAIDLAPKVRVNCVCPADVATPLLERQLLEAGDAYDIRDMETAYPLGRIGRVDEVAHVICSVASPANSFMTGSIVAVDGGVTAS